MEQPTVLPPRADRLPHAFTEQTLLGQIVVAFVGPVLLGGLSGLVLGLSGPAYWALQAVAAVGGLLAGLEHRGARPGALRGLLGGALFGTALLAVRAVSGLDDHATLDQPWLLPVVTALVSCGLGALGGRWRARTLSRRTAA